MNAAKQVYQPLGVPHRGITLSHPSNPVVFFDVESAGQRRRFLFELFADLAPTLAANMYVLCVGGATRMVDQRPVPAGYKGSTLHDALVGEYILGGDVMGAAGSGFFSATGERNGPLDAPPGEVAALDAAAPGRCAGDLRLYMQCWNHTRGAPRRVASAFRVDAVERPAAEAAPEGAVLLGRMVHRDDAARADAGRQVSEVAKAIFLAKRAAQSQMPTIVLCGEM